MKNLWMKSASHEQKKEDEKGSTFSTHRNADCLLKNTSIKHNQYIVNHKLDYIDDISFRERFGRIGVFCPFLKQEICIFVMQSF